MAKTGATQRKQGVPSRFPAHPDEIKPDSRVGGVQNF
jgi:hypothetical protein